MTNTRATAATVAARVAAAAALLQQGLSTADAARQLADAEGLSLRQAQRLIREAAASLRLPPRTPAAAETDWLPVAEPEATPYAAMASKLEAAIDAALEASDWRAAASLASTWRSLQLAHDRAQPLRRFGDAADRRAAAEAIDALPADLPF